MGISRCCWGSALGERGPGSEAQSPEEAPTVKSRRGPTKRGEGILSSGLACLQLRARNLPETGGLGRRERWPWGAGAGQHGTSSSPGWQASLGEWGTDEPGPELSPTAGPSRETPLPEFPLDPMSTHARRPVPGRNSENCQMERWTQPITYYVFCLYVLNLQVPIFHWFCRFLS